jgi:pimeloyl-ACP methyl ester carboxylesterase
MTMPMYEKGSVRIHYEEHGTGTPLLIIPGGGLNATMSFFTGRSPFNAPAEFKDQYRCITLDARNANAGLSTGPLDLEHPWDAYADDQLGLMDHLGIDTFLVMGFCIGGPFIWNLLKRAPERIIAAVMAQPSGHRPELPDQFYENNMKDWGPTLCAHRPDLDMSMVHTFLEKMYRANPDFVFTVSRDFVSQCQTPIFVMPDDTAPHPLAVAMEVVKLAPNAEVSLYPWKEPKERIPQAVAQARAFLDKHRPK